jgi:hypothetical protein
VATQVITGQSNLDQAGAVTVTQFKTKNQDNGIFIQEEAIINDAVSLTAAFVLTDHRITAMFQNSLTYPKAGISWNLTRMGWLNNDGFFENLKIRAAYGQAGNFPAYGSKFTGMSTSNIEGLPGSLVGTQRGQPTI